MYYPWVRRALFQLDPEVAHHLTLSSLATAERLGLLRFWPKVPDHPVSLWGLNFRNPVGLAAGLDKNGDYIDALGALGFGFIEIGTVTPRPQPGNPKPRIFRLPSAQALINRLGFNNAGVDHLIVNVERARYDGILGINIGKNADTPVERAVEDYLICLDKVYDRADYVTVNISSPNTVGLRSLQETDTLRRLLGTLKERQLQLSSSRARHVPLLVKVAPDLTPADIEGMANVLLESGVEGVIATNTTIQRSAVAHLPHGQEAGGLSGRPVFVPSTQVLQAFHQALEGRLPLIGVGGVHDAASAADKAMAGAALVQMYTGFIYEGPQVIAAAARGMRAAQLAAAQKTSS